MVASDPEFLDAETLNYVAPRPNGTIPIFSLGAMITLIASGRVIRLKSHRRRTCQELIPSADISTLRPTLVLR